MSLPLRTPPLERSPQDGGTLRAETLRDLEALGAIRSDWLALGVDQVTADPDYFAMTVETEPFVLRPHVVVLHEAGSCRALVAARLEEFDLACRIGYAKAFKSRVRSLTTVYGGVLGAEEESVATRVVDELRAALARREADIAILRHVPVGGALHRIASTSPPFLRRQHVSKRLPHRELRLPATYAELLSSLSKSTREGVKRYGRRFEKEFGERIGISRYRDAAGAEELFAAIRVVAPKTYQHGLGVAFGEDRHLEQARYCLQRGWYRAWVLTVDDEPVGFWHGEEYGGRFRLGRPGYDPAYADHRVGTYLMMRAIEDLCESPDVHVVDFGVGDAEYKRRFSNQAGEEEDVLIYGPTLRSARINLTRTVVLGSADAAGRVLRRGGRYEKIKRRWRARLTGE